jgi:hypothetical protein
LARASRGDYHTHSVTETGIDGVMSNLVPTRLSLMVVVVAALVVGCSDKGNAEPDEADRDIITKDPLKTPPKIVFSDDYQSTNASLDAFIREFADICVRGEYDQYRLKVRRRSDPVSKEDFEQVWHHVEQVRIDAAIALPGTEDTPGPRYAVFANVRVSAEDAPEKNVVLQVLKEGEAWVIDVMPTQELTRLYAAAQAATAPVTQATTPQATTTQASATRP